MYALELDENLIVRMASGDGEAFRELYQKAAGPVYGFALSILRNRHDAEDVMHDAFIKTYQNAGSYKPKGKPWAWIMTIVRNLCYDRLRAGKACEDVTMYEGFGSAGDDASERGEEDLTLDRLVLREALAILGAEDRQIVVLHALTGMKHREIAELLEMPVGTVLSKYNRALKRMRDEINGKDREHDR